MNGPEMAAPLLAERLYVLAVWGYPRAHRQSYGALMVQAFRDDYRGVLARQGRVGLRFWLDVFVDTVSSLVREWGAELAAGGERLAQHRLAALSGAFLIGGILLSLAACAR